MPNKAQSQYAETIKIMSKREALPTKNETVLTIQISNENTRDYQSTLTIINKEKIEKVNVIRKLSIR